MPKGKIHHVIIGLGSNIDPYKNIEKAKARLAKDLKIAAESSFLMTKPLGKTDQADFLNGAILVETRESIKELKSRLKNIETALGRETSRKGFDPRTIDLDILVWDERIVNKDFYDREFIRSSVLELRPLLKY